VPERCTCGAELPPDALFCHKCGKPQREIVEPEPPPTFGPRAIRMAALPPPVPDLAPAPPKPIGFHNGPAVRVALLVGVLSILISAIGEQVAPPVLAPIWLIASGMLAAFLYKLRTGQRLSALSGARLGWISGIFGFVIVAGLLAMFLALLRDPNYVSLLRDQWTERGRQADFDQVIAQMQHPIKMLLALGGSFVLFVLFTTFGGAIGARLLDRD
jgi:pheromone shutdown protein TraB